MKKLKEVSVFTDGDSSQISTWSNVPFFLTETLLSKGIKVNRIDISPTRNWESLFYKTSYRILSRINKQTSYSYLRSLTHFINTKKKIATAVKKHPNSDANIFITCSFSSKSFSNKPVILFFDWTYSYDIEYFAGRNPDFFERQAIKREDAQIMSADLLFPLFPSITEYMRNRYLGKQIFYLGNVINSLYTVSADDIATKSNSNSLLFVGSIKYIAGARSLLAAFELLKVAYPAITLDIIGIKQSDFSAVPAGITCHGYLDKGNDKERELYYNIFRKASVFINTTPKWGAFSASIEAMYFYTPVIITPYKEFLTTFGENINFGYYCEENDATLIKNRIVDILESKSYKQLCFNANSAVKDFTWDAYVDKMVEKIEGIID
ncbi:MAG: glycosyltransferase family 1 protein [Hymenobacter sp.]|nr:MAG: glycosyltransferase family 1 protein [Hymenobacter sp.]